MKSCLVMFDDNKETCGPKKRLDLVCSCLLVSIALDADDDKCQGSVMSLDNKSFKGSSDSGFLYIHCIYYARLMCIFIIYTLSFKH